MKNFSKQKWFKAPIIAIVVLFAVPTVTLGGTFVSSLIQGKTVEEAVQILANQLDGVLDRLGVIENKQSALDKKIYCLELIKKTPDWGDSAYVNKDIVNFYKSAQEQLIFWQNNPDDALTKMSEKWQKTVNEAESLYTKYIQECGTINN
jgi:hypothetical protein